MRGSSSHVSQMAVVVLILSNKATKRERQANCSGRATWIEMPHWERAAVCFTGVSTRICQCRGGCVPQENISCRVVYLFISVFYSTFCLHVLEVFMPGLHTATLIWFWCKPKEGIALSLELSTAYLCPLCFVQIVFVFISSMSQSVHSVHSFCAFMS